MGGANIHAVTTQDCFQLGLTRCKVGQHLFRGRLGKIRIAAIEDMIKAFVAMPIGYGFNTAQAS